MPEPTNIETDVEPVTWDDVLSKMPDVLKKIFDATEVQDVIAAGQLRPTDQLIDVQQMPQSGTLTVFLQPLYEGELDDIPPGSSCIANAYTNNHDALADKNIGTIQWLFLHVVDTVGLVHAMILRIQALLLPVQTLVFASH